MMLKILLVDDELLARQRLRTLLADCTEPQAEVLAEAANGPQASFKLRPPEGAQNGSKRLKNRKI